MNPLIWTLCDALTTKWWQFAQNSVYSFCSVFLFIIFVALIFLVVAFFLLLVWFCSHFASHFHVTRNKWTNKNKDVKQNAEERNEIWQKKLLRITVCCQFYFILWKSLRQNETKRYEIVSKCRSFVLLSVGCFFFVQFWIHSCSNDSSTTTKRLCK